MIIILLLAFDFVMLLINSALLAKLWAWFVVPQFGVEPIGNAMALGLALVIGFATAQYVNYGDDPDELVGGYVMQSVLRTLSVFVVGATAAQFV